MKTARRHYTPSDKVAILRRHLIDRVSVSDLCDQYQLKTHALLQLAEAVLRERCCRFPVLGKEGHGLQGSLHRSTGIQAPAQARGGC
jgi:hypothetical protein